MSDAPSLQHTGEGYEYFRCRASGDDATVYVHRLLYVAEHGFEALPDGWHVHHKGGVPWLNVPWALEAVPPEEHAAHHLQGDPLAATDGGTNEPRSRRRG